jgi:hypothetical protein
MTDVTQYIKQALYDCLAGKIVVDSVTIPVKASFSLAEGLTKAHIILDNITDEQADTLSNYSSMVRATIQVVDLPDGYTEKTVNAIAAHVRAKITPSFGQHGLTIPAGMQALHVRVSSPDGIIAEWEEGRPILRKILFVTLQINHS